ncbi:MAG TPA: hypothetical protein VLW50_13230 [Streptosporangiaceae bacterium]|nr:hypothetical protein [Streptosporangiaceae bacterium]
MARAGHRPGPSRTREEIRTAATVCFTAAGYGATSVRQVAAVAGWFQH